MSLAEAKPPAAAGKIPTAEELIARARALAPKLRERAIKAERDRNIPRELVEEYIDAGLIQRFSPSAGAVTSTITRSPSTSRSSSGNQPAALRPGA